MTETSKIGLLTEMSYIELQERLQYLKAKDAAAEEAKRQEILLEKTMRETVLQDKLTLIAKARAEMTRTRPPRHTLPVWKLNPTAMTINQFHRFSRKLLFPTQRSMSSESNLPRKSK